MRWDPRTKQQPTGLFVCPAHGGAVLFKSWLALRTASDTI